MTEEQDPAIQSIDATIESILTDEQAAAVTAASGQRSKFVTAVRSADQRQAAVLDRLRKAGALKDQPPQALPGEGDFELSAEQNEAIARINNSEKRVIVLTGQAGAGKSTINNALKKSGWWTPTATTGKAAMHIEGSTVDATFCFSREDWSIWSDSYLESIMRDISDNIIIDEASMIGEKMGDIIFKVAQLYKKKLLLVGDWAQAAPVKDGLILDSLILQDYEFIKLMENHRQGEGPFMEVLNKLRLGITDDSVNTLMKQQVCATPPEDDRYIRLYATNRKTDAYNNMRLWRHVADTGCQSLNIYTKFQDMRPEIKQKGRPRSEQYKTAAINNSPFGHGEPLAIGCRVVVTANATVAEAGAFVNGDAGVLVGGIAEDGRPLEQCLTDYENKGTQFRVTKLYVRLDRHGGNATISRMRREVKDPTGRYVQHALSGFPIKLGYAMTFHKAQGMTVDRAWVDMESLRKFPNDKSRHGLAYVALSRTRSLEGLLLGSWEPDMVYCNPDLKQLL